jgi:hypothetical protein
MGRQGIKGGLEKRLQAVMANDEEGTTQQLRMAAELIAEILQQVEQLQAALLSLKVYCGLKVKEPE